VSGFRCQISGWAASPSAVAVFAAFVVVFVFVLVFISELRNFNPFSIAFWLTPDQQGDRMMGRGEFAEAAKQYRDPPRIGTALYRAGEFKEAARAFGRLKTPEGHFNRGNALLMQGKYTEAVEAYEKALAARPALAAPGRARICRATVSFDHRLKKREDKNGDDARGFAGTLEGLKNPSSSCSGNQGGFVIEVPSSQSSKRSRDHETRRVS